ncbi:DUF3667 domain-containing protein [Flagellimonas halotolerans]|uniref:DUF3667 domain-containing protein n=1 Tax=Flagellimonas halotolerans TaxID=3112164 RepID=A0ABU6IQ70_9FLAO|nr:MULTISPECIES: DUF3667 domain-containing protein [unclassified Allomuricauda]MEC3965393.1 DUF3667 domain-containing protein [Muricauda sp. SYSU M86414]MEC4265259.1 DUF3667 domain-containing protein [Muricauda sp. SYSU M84420]
MAKKDGLITKGRYELKFRGVKCLNCGHPLDISDKYCPNCSQANSTKKLTLKDFIDEFFSGLINYDSRLIKSLSALLLRPGRITKDYVNGKRITYTNPFRFLLSLAFIYFLMFAYNSNFTNLDEAAKNFDGNIYDGSPFKFDMDSGDLEVDSVVLEKQSKKAQRALDSLKKVNPGVLVGMQKFDSIKAVDPELSQQLKYLDSLGVFVNGAQQKVKKKDSFMDADPTGYFKNLEKESGIGGFSKKVEFFRHVIKKDTLFNFEEAETRYNIGKTWTNRMAFNSANSILRAIREPGSWVNRTISKLPFVIFFFMPVFTVFIWLVYIRKNYTYTDHLIFSFHNQSLLFILLILSLTLDTIFNINSSGIFLLIFAIYLYKAMRKFYGQGRFKTIVKYIFLNTVFMILAFFTIIVTFAGSGLTY